MRLAAARNVTSLTVARYARRSGGLQFPAGFGGKGDLPDFDVDIIGSPKGAVESGISPRRILGSEMKRGGGGRVGGKGNGGSGLKRTGKSSSNNKSSVYDIEDADFVANVFISRVSAKLRKLAECKKAFQDIVNGALREQERAYEKMRKLVEEVRNQ